MEDENVTMFIMATGATEAEAHQYLSVANNDCNLAVEIYMENGPQQKYVSPSDFGNFSNFGNHGDNIGGQGGNFGNRDHFSDHDDNFEPDIQPEIVREPIPQKRETLVKDVPPILARLKKAEVPKSVFENAETLSSDPYGSKKSKLAELFRAPTEIMELGSFEEAREKAGKEKKWLMINVIDPSNFTSQVQNRDLWRDSVVQELVKAHCIFMQFGTNTTEGKEYLRLYTNFVYPHISIIDPRTGERVASWNENFTPTTFMMKMGDFFDSWSLETNKRPKNETIQKKNVLTLTEDEQLELALAASLDPEEPEVNDPDIDMFHDEGEDDEDRDEEKEEKSAVNEVRSTPWGKLKAVQHNEPEANAPGATRVQIRLKDGSKIVRRFLKTDQVRVIYEHLKAIIPDLAAPGIEFELNLHSGKTSDKLDQTLEEAGVANSALNLSY